MGQECWKLSEHIDRSLGLKKALATQVRLRVPAHGIYSASRETIDLAVNIPHEALNNEFLEADGDIEA